MFSFHPTKPTTFNPGNYSKGFNWINTDDLEIIGRLCKTFFHSAIVWKDGVRTSDNFNGANWLQLDFDDGRTLEEGCELFKDYTHIIGTSKSHQLEKKGKVCDRFHVYLKLDTITPISKEDYLATLKFYTKKFNTDPAATDAARMFYPIKDVKSAMQGMELKIKKYLRPESNRPRFMQPRDDLTPKRWLNHLLEYGPPPGVSRNTCCFKVACHLKRLGFTEDEVLTQLMNSAIPIASSVHKEVQAVVASAWKRY